MSMNRVRKHHPDTSRYCLTLLAFVLLGTLSGLARAADAISEITIFGNGSGLSADLGSTGMPVSASINGIAGTISYAPAQSTEDASGNPIGMRPGGFSMNQTVIPGNTGEISVSYTLAAPAKNATQTITFKANTASKTVTVTGTDSAGGVYFGNSASLKVNNTTVPATMSGGNFTATANGSLDDGSLRSCVATASGINICINALLVSKSENTAESASERPSSATGVKLFNTPIAGPAINGTNLAASDLTTSALSTPTTPAATASAIPGPTASATAAALPSAAAASTLSSDNYVAGLQMFAEQMSNIMLYQLPIIAAMLDAKHQLESQRLYGIAGAIAHSEYHPSEQLCAFGTLARSTAPSQFRMSDNIAMLDTILQKRETLNINQASAWGPSGDMGARLDQYKAVYCDKKDDGGYLDDAGVCTTSGASLRKNKDIDYRRTIEDGLTKKINFTDATSTPDEEDALALAKNLYASDVLSAIPEDSIAPYGSYRELQDSRMLSAVRSVARYSYATIVAAKAEGTGLQAAQLQQVMTNLGVPAADVVSLVGDNPSYFAQMEFMTQKMYQDPNFFTGLYMNPANVARMKVVLQAIRLMADRDRFEESLRREMLISMLLEMRLRQSQEEVKNTTNLATSPPVK